MRAPARASISKSKSRCPRPKRSCHDLMQTQPRLLIVDDHPVFRRGLREIIEEDRFFRIVGEASDGQSALELAPATNPDIIAVDINMPPSKGLENARALPRRESARPLAVRAQSRSCG